LVAETGEALIELGDHAAHRVGLDIELGLPAGKSAGSDPGHHDVRHVMPTSSLRGAERRSNPLPMSLGRREIASLCSQ
jgi:hypothetical protein